jgi:POT family proton-dependent oligopeptide transporter
MSDAVVRRRGFFGEPSALGYLAFTEIWERFSFYGMLGLLTLYMTQQLFLPGHAEHVAGLAGFRAALEAVFGKMSTLGFAAQIYGLYSGLVYFTPVFGGLIADRLIGKRNAVMLGALLMSAGHLAMAFEASFLLALLLLIVGCGLLKGNISAQVGTLYADSEIAGRTRGYSIYSMGINIGATAGPLVCGLLAAAWGWDAGFGVAGILMLVGLATYAIGFRKLEETGPRIEHRAVAPLDAAQRRTVLALVAVMALTIFQSIAYYQNGGIALVWIDAHVDLGLFGWSFPVAWFNSIDPFVSIIAVPPLVALWRRQAARGREPDEIGKIAIGAFMAAFANLLLVIGALAFGRVPAIFPVVYDVILGVAFLYYWPTLLALVSRTAPPALKSTLMGTAFLSLFVSNTTVGWLGGLYEHMTPAAFWSMHAAIATAGGVLALLVNRPLARLFAASH